MNIKTYDIIFNYHLYILCSYNSKLGDALHCIQLLLTEMIHLVQQMAYYMTFEVLECSWHTLTSNLTMAQSLDDVIEAHAQFLKRIVSGALLDEDSRQSNLQDESETGNARSDSELKEREEMRRINFSSKFVSEFRSELFILKESYQDMVKVFC
ncbi:Gamma-tubulin complex component 3 [Armadillidium vulgare]|nr:Gamma-tubulin complex component 3 [Armadillidium vulgare]